MRQSNGENEILLELTAVGNLLRVAAVDPTSLIEVTFQAPLGTDRATLAALAQQKISFVSRRRSNQG